VKTKVSQRTWTHWYQCPYIEYIAGQPADPANSGDSQTPTNDENSSLSLGTRLLRYKTGRKMASGDDVLAIQKRLHDLGFNPGKLDGVYGSVTEAAVKAFQTKAAIEVDGIVGPVTRTKLKK
jgi:peptidoglycan hydrolase-like protein with peptidoglycan-binding domain